MNQGSCQFFWWWLKRNSRWHTWNSCRDNDDENSVVFVIRRRLNSHSLKMTMTKIQTISLTRLKFCVWTWTNWLAPWAVKWWGWWYKLLTQKLSSFSYSVIICCTYTGFPCLGSFHRTCVQSLCDLTRGKSNKKFTFEQSEFLKVNRKLFQKVGVTKWTDVTCMEALWWLYQITERSFSDIYCNTNLKMWHYLYFKVKTVLS